MFNNQVITVEYQPLLTVNSTSGGSVTTNPSGRVVANATYTAVAVPDEGYRFDGWYNGVTKVYSTATANLAVAAADITYTAKFVSRYHTVTAGLSASSPVGSGTVRLLADGVEVASGTAVIDGTEVRVVCTPGIDYNHSYWLVNNVVWYGATHTFTVDESSAGTIDCRAVMAEKSIYAIVITNTDPTRGAISLSDGEKSWSESSGSITATGHSGVRYTITADVTSATSETGRELNMFGGVTKNGSALAYSEVESGKKYRATFSNGNNLSGETLDDLTIVATFAAKPLRQVEISIPIAAGGTAVVEPEPDVTSPGDRWLEGTVTAVATPNTGYYVNSFNVADLDYGPNGHVVQPVKDNDGMFRDSFLLNFNARITVNFLKIPCTVGVSVDSASTAVSAGTATVRSTAQGGSMENMVYGDVAVFEATANTNYQFGGWYDKATGLPAADSTITSQGVSTTYHYYDAEYRVALVGNLELVAKFKAQVTIGAAFSENAQGTIYLDELSSSSSAISKWVTIGENVSISAVPLEEGEDFFGGWYLSSDSGFANPLDLSADETFAVDDTLSYVARFTSSADVLFVAMCNFDNGTMEADASLGSLMMMVGGATPVEAETCTEEEYLEATDLSAAPAGAVKYYKLMSTARVSLSASPAAGLGFAKWTRLTVSEGQMGDETQISTAANVSTVVNRNYIFRAYWGDPMPVRLTLNYCDGSYITSGVLKLEGVSEANPDIENRTETSTETSATFTQNDIVKISVDIKNGYLFAGWFYDREGTEPLRDTTVNGVTYKYTDAEYRFVVSSPMLICAKFQEDTNALYEWAGRDKSKVARWRSKTFVASKPFDPSACRIDALGYGADEDGVLTLKIDMFSSPEKEASASNKRSLTINSQDMRRLPVGRLERYMQIEVQSNREVDAIFIGTNTRDLAV